MFKNLKVIVKFKNVDAQSKESVINSLGGTIVNTLNSINAVIIMIPSNKIKIIRSDPDVEYIDISTEKDVSILGFQDVQASIRQDLSIPWNVSKIRAVDVWNYGIKGKGVKGCVIDTGIDYSHPNLADAYKGGYNFIDNTDDPSDDNGHGSHVSGIAVARDTGNGVIGVAPEMDIYSLKVLDSNGSGSYANIVSAIQWAINNRMNVINMSFGGSNFNQALKDICDVAYNSGILLVAAAGNSGFGNDTISYPAKLDSVIAVGATDINDNRGSFSSTGSKLEVSAPGVLITSTVPKGNCKFCTPTGINTLSGTSMSSPEVFATAALLISSDSDITNIDIRNIINKNSVDLGQSGRDMMYGFGRIDAKSSIDDKNPPPPPVIKYKCTGFPDYKCVTDSDGTFNNIEECQNECKKPIPPISNNKYSVQSLGNTGVIVLKLPFGNLDSISACSEACKIIRDIDSK